jgi:exosortase D (VPLPA-CTERM-specific)
MSTVSTREAYVWKESLTVWGALLIAITLAIILFQDGLSFMVRAWDGQEEYSYGYLIPFISLFLIWQKKDVLQTILFSGAWAGCALTLIGVLFFLLGQLSAAYAIIQYSFVMVLFGLALAFVGWRGFRVIFVPLLFLAFMVPLPGFLNQSLSNTLQLISSELGVAVVRLCGITVYLEGNVVDLGTYKLEVAEACSGLRYLFPLMTFGLIAAYFFKVSLWKRVLLFLSTIPITVIMNSVRIGLIGVTVEYWGPSMAEGLLHDFEGWVMFMACTGVLALEMWLLTCIGSDQRPLREVFGLTFPRPISSQAHIKYRSIPAPFYVAVALVLVVMALSYALPERKEVIPSRQQFSSFPMTIDEWIGKPQSLDAIYVDALNFDDYLMADYRNIQGNEQSSAINFYVGYYATQRADKVPHSPRACLPGGGWKISEIGEYGLPGVVNAGQPMKVNRAMIEKGEEKLLVYYWFQQRGRIITDEYAVKGYLLWDAMNSGRSDGALVRLMVSLSPGQDIADADAALTRFAASMLPELPHYVPN